MTSEETHMQASTINLLDLPDSERSLILKQAGEYLRQQVKEEKQYRAELNA